MSTNTRPSGATSLPGAGAKIRPPSECTSLDQEQLRLLAKTFAGSGPACRADEQSISLIELGLRLGAERDPKRLLYPLCRTARNVLGAREAVLAIHGRDAGFEFVVTSGVDEAAVAGLRRGDFADGPIGAALDAGLCARGANPDGSPGRLGLPGAFPSVFAWLAAPISTDLGSYGWVCFTGKSGGLEFSPSDEALAATLAQQMARIYERSRPDDVAAPIIEVPSRQGRGKRPLSRTEEDLRASEELFRSAFELTNVAMVLTDIENRFIRINAAFARLLGYTQGELLAMTMADVTHPEDLAESYAKREALIRGDEEFFQIEKRYLHKDGRTVWGLTNVSLMRDRRGEPLVYIGQVQDVTQRKRAEQELRREKEFVRQVIDADPNILFVKDAGGRLVLVNEAFAALFETTPDSLIGRAPGVDLTPAEEHDEHRRTEEEVLRTGRAAALDEVWTLNGETRWFRMLKTPFAAADGGVRLLGIGADVTGRREAETALRASEARMRLMLDTASDAFIAIDAGGFIVDWNRKAQTTFGWSRAEVLGRRLSDLIVPKRFRAMHEKGLREYLATGVGPVLHNRVVIPALRRDGNEFTVEMLAWPTPVGGTVVVNAFLRSLPEESRVPVAPLGVGLAAT